MFSPRPANLNIEKRFQVKKLKVYCPFAQTYYGYTKKTKFRGLSPRANYTDRAAAAGRRS
jgi:hypothetical protein